MSSAEMKVYIVTDGDGMDGREIGRVFSRREDADKHAGLRNANPWDDYRVEEWTVDEHEQVVFYTGKVWHGHYRLDDDHYRVTQVDYSGVRLADAELLDRDSHYVTVWGMEEKAVSQFLYDRAQELKADRAGAVVGR